MQKNIQNITAVIEYIEAHLTEKLDLDTIADAVHYSKYHLHRMFADMTGLTAHDYIQRRRLTEAAKLLVFSDKPILEIALLAGYESQQAFTGIFTALYKMPPNRYRESERFYPLQLKYSLKGSYSMLENKEIRWRSAPERLDFPYRLLKFYHLPLCQCQMVFLPTYAFRCE